MGNLDILSSTLATMVILLIVAFVVALAARLTGRTLRLSPKALFLILVAVLVLSLGVALWQRERAVAYVRFVELTQLKTESNLIYNSVTVVNSLTATLPVSPPPTSAINLVNSDAENSAVEVILKPDSYLSSHVVPIQPGQKLRYSLSVTCPAQSDGRYQVRLLWYDTSLTLLSWTDSPTLAAQPETQETRDSFTLDYGKTFRERIAVAPSGSTRVRMEVRNVGQVPIFATSLKLSQLGAYVEQHPYGTRGSLAFSFDWESALGGPIHSRGMTAHDPGSAAQHGLQMRQGADWLMGLFDNYNVKGTFYATGYNFLDGNTHRRTFSGDPIYKWATPRNGWSSEHWLTHKWYGDDPLGTVESAPEWYFGDQTRALLEAGHEIGSHTFGHLYVRGSKPEELAADMDEWIAAADAVGVPRVTTFAFPWRSSNSLTPDFYDVLYSRGIRAVTRLYERDLRDLYTISAVPTYTQMLVMPDFRLEAPTANIVEEAAGEVIGLERGTQVLDEVIARRGTTSFWTHPEQLANSSDFDQVKRNWEGVVSYAAARRDRGLLWNGTVAEIVAYQRDVMSVTTRLEPGFLGLGDWSLEVRNNSGREIKGLTLTLPSEVSNASSSSVQVRTARFEGDKVILSPADQPAFPVRQLVFETLPPGVTQLSLSWADGQEPPR